MRSLIVFLLLASASLTSCESKTGTGVLVGGAVGAGVGGAVGGGEGALIGGASGVIAGGLVGAYLDEQDRKKMESQSPQTLKKIDNGEPLSVDDVIKMSKAGLSDNVIIDQIDASKSTFHLSSEEIVYMKKSGVSEKVIDYMIETGK